MTKGAAGALSLSLSLSLSDSWNWQADGQTLPEMLKYTAMNAKAE